MHSRRDSELENVLGEVKDFFKSYKKAFSYGALGLGLAISALGSFYIVPPDSAGVVARFGRIVREEKSGPHFKLPLGIEDVRIVPVERVQKQEFGFRTIKSGVDSHYIGADSIRDGKASENDIEKVLEEIIVRVEQKGTKKDLAEKLLRGEYLMLTGDLNFADVEFVVQYKIKDPTSYLTNVREPIATLRDTALSIMKEIVGDGSVDEVITVGRIDYNNRVKQELQKLLDKYIIGIHVVLVNLQSTHAPFKVRESFNAVNQAMQKKETRINEAKKFYNDEVPRADGDAQKIIETAKGYAIERTNKADGDIAQFDKILTEYRKAPEVTRKRLHLEVMERILPKIKEKTIVDIDDGSLNILNLNPRQGAKNDK